MRLIEKALTFDDVLLLPAYTAVLPRETDLSSRFSRRLELKLPLVSAAMDTVTDSRLAIALAQEGGLGILHKNLSPRQQAAEVLKVKRHEAGVLRDPITIGPDMKIRDVIELTRQHRISGLPVVEGPKVIGIITNRDLRFETRLDAPVREIMTQRDQLVTVREGASLEEAKSLMHRHRLERVVVVNGDFELRGLITVKDITKATEHPSAAKDELGKLRVGAAVGVGEADDERCELLVKAGVDVLVVDTAHGHSQGVLDRVRWIKRNYPQIDVVGGNIATAAAAVALAEQGVDAVKVGIGPGMAGMNGIECVARLKALHPKMQIVMLTVYEDTEQIFKALAAGAWSVMMGSMFAGTEEAPGETILYEGRSYKSYRGMGSLGAMQQGAADRYFQDYEANADKLVPEGIEGMVPYKGSVLTIVYQLAGGVRSSMGYCGCRTIEEMRTRAEFVEITSAGMRESHVHDVRITKEAPNYRVE